MPQRPRFTTREREAVLRRPDNPNGEGNCWHCGTPLDASKFHVDHHPVAYRDIEDQICFGVTDPKDMTNLVPSCPTCNTSHAHEISNCSGHTQFRVTKFCMVVLFAVVGWGGTVVMGIFLMYAVVTT